MQFCKIQCLARLVPVDNCASDYLWEYGLGGLQGSTDQGRRLGTEVDSSAIISILRWCIESKNVLEGRRVHDLIVNKGLERDTFLGNLLMEMYAKSGAVKHARFVFDKIHKRNVFSWTIMIAAYAQVGCDIEALKLYKQMEQGGEAPNKFTFSTILGACSSLKDLEEGKMVHTSAAESGHESDVVVANALVNMYSKCESLMDSGRVFEKMCKPDVVSWTAMIAAYAQNGRGREALQLYSQMERDGIEPNRVTFMSALAACGILGAIDQGKTIHHSVVYNGFVSDVVVSTALIDMFGKCGSCEDARRVFDKLSTRDIISWNAMITAYVQHRHSESALQLYRAMQWEGVEPNEVTFLSVLSACSSLADLAKGNTIHASIANREIMSDLLAIALVNMYGKCGSLEDAWMVFNIICRHDVVSWTAMIAAYAQNGYGPEALQLFMQMEQEGVKPNEITFINVLSACSHSGLLEDGHRHFISMNEDHGIKPTVEHYACMVDLLGRAGLLHEAEIFINEMPLQADIVLWRSLLGACSVHGDVEHGRHAAEQSFNLDKDSDAPYVLLSNILSAN